MNYVFIAPFSCYGKSEQSSFAVVHGSFIVNLKHIKTFFGGQVILAGGTELTVSRGL